MLLQGSLATMSQNLFPKIPKASSLNAFCVQVEIIAPTRPRAMRSVIRSLRGLRGCRAVGFWVLRPGGAGLADLGLAEPASHQSSLVKPQ